VFGTASATDATGFLVSTAGTRVPVEVSGVPLKNGERVVGVSGLIEEPSSPFEMDGTAKSNQGLGETAGPGHFCGASIAPWGQ
jgi:hypothetical protein